MTSEPRIKLIDMFMFIITITLVSFMFWAIWYLKKEGFNCLVDPLRFAGKSLNTTCYCIRTP